MITTTGNVTRAEHCIWGCTQGCWAGLIQSIDCPLQSTAATQLRKCSLLPLCSKAKNGLWCWRKGWWNNSSFFLFSATQGEQIARKKTQTHTYLPRWGSSFLPLGWTESVASFSEAAQWLQRKLQLSQFWCREILSFPTLNDQRRLFGHWSLLASFPKAAQELRVKAAAVKWQDYKSLSEGWWKWNCLKFCWKIPACFLLCSSQQNRITIFSLLRAVHLVDKGR